MDQLSLTGDMLDCVELSHFGVSGSYIYAYIGESEERSGRSALEVAQSTMNLHSPFGRVRSVLAQVAEIEEQKNRK